METYGTLPDGRTASVYTLTNSHGVIARVTNYGAILVSLEVPDRDGHLADLTLGYDTLEGWLEDPFYINATVGRFGNRIAHGKFTLEGETVHLATNNDPGGFLCHLHGGKVGLNQKLWHGAQEGNKVTLTHTSPDGDEGFPGTLEITVTYELTDDNELIWHAQATTDRPTPVNIINHNYWNLSGDLSRSILDHEMMIPADAFLPTGADMIPTGTLAPVIGTPLDFTKATPLGARIKEPYQALIDGEGYDHCFVLRDGGDVRLAARAVHPASGRSLEISTNQPGVHLYTGNHLNNSVVAKKGKKMTSRTGFCLETEAFPDAPNQETFPSCILRPGETYSHLLHHKISW